MSNHAVIKGASYFLAHTPDMLINNGTTQTTERIVNPTSEYLTEMPKHLRSYEECLAYIPNQVYIGNLKNEDLAKVEFPFYDKKAEKPERYGKYGEIMPQGEFYGVMQISDAFDLVWLEQSFSQAIKASLAEGALFSEEQLNILDKNQNTEDELKAFVEEEHAEGLYMDNKLVGVVKRAHDVDVNLSAHTMLENIVAKASSVLSIKHLIKNTGVAPESVEYVLDCCEEACGDMNQRGGGNFAKAAAETAGLTGATGSDVRGFCAGPAHAILSAASLVKAGTFRSVVVTAGGCTAKLGMNGKDHVKKDLPLLEDCIAGFAILITENDGINPVIRNDIVGRHTVGTGSAPQNVIGSLVTDALDKANLKITDVDKFAPELQNPDITKPAGAGDVPESNYKMIAALGVKRGDIERTDIPEFVAKHGLVGWAPTQGHIPSGVPFIGDCRDQILEDKIEKAMIIGKGSLFLGRMTNLFDGVSFLIEKNEAAGSKEEAASTDAAGTTDAAGATDTKETSKGVIAPVGVKGAPDTKPVIGVAVHGTELGIENIEKAVEIAKSKGYEAVIIDGDDAHDRMEKMIASGEIHGAVTMHYPFPIGVSTVGRVVTPAHGKEMFLATTTGTSSTDRIAGMILNTVSGIATAKACGVKSPTVGISNIEGAHRVEAALRKLAENGYEINFASSAREDGGVVMRGNDLLAATPDVMVIDPLTGNLMMKMFSAYNSGGFYEATGYGYGPGIGEGYDKVIMIVSRASGAPVIASAIEYATQIIENDVKGIVAKEYEAANKAKLKEIISEASSGSGSQGGGSSEGGEVTSKSVDMPQKEVVTHELMGIEITELDAAAEALWSSGIYAETGMGCTGPVILVSEANGEKAESVLKEKGFIS